MKLLEHYSGKTHVGLTATPWRSDRKGLNEYYQDIVVVRTPLELMKDGYILEPRVFAIPREDLADLGRVRVVGGDYDETQLAIAMDVDTLVGDIVDHWRKRANGVRTVAFACSVKHSQHIVQRFCDAGFRFVHLDGNSTIQERSRILKMLESHEIDGVSNCALFTEGWDSPQTGCAILARPTLSESLCMQQVGRVLRSCPGKPMPVILDHAGCLLEHGLPQEDRTYSLDPPEPRGAMAHKSCPQCLALLVSFVQVCPVCGHCFTTESKTDDDPVDKTIERAGELIEVRPATTDEKRAVWDSLCKAATDKGYGVGWARKKYKARFGTFPPNSFGVPKVDYSHVSFEDKALDWARITSIGISKGYKPGWAYVVYSKKYGEDPPL